MSEEVCHVGLVVGWCFFLLFVLLLALRCCCSCEKVNDDDDDEEFVVGNERKRVRGREREGSATIAQATLGRICF